jgi:hypothetical protein
MTLDNEINLAGLRAQIGDEDYLYPANQPGVTVCVLWLLGGQNVTGMFGPDSSVDALTARENARDAAYAELISIDTEKRLQQRLEALKRELQ